jgi:endonuclease/exonuclease/phosphatase family metal-dependent hydrolase
MSSCQVGTRSRNPDDRRDTMMGRMIRLLMVLVLAGTALAAAAEVQPGDQVRFITREQHIPAHPAPGDARVHLRFVSGSEATVLRAHGATGWVEVRGEPVQGTETTGWATLRYLAGQPGGEGPTAGTLAWCPAKGSSAPHPSGRLRLATWNLENLHAQDGQSTYTGNDPSVTRTAVDDDRIRCYVRLFDPDVLAVQEVDGEAALSRVVDTDVYDVHVDDRPKGSLNGQQNTGFAFKRGLTVVRQPDFTALDVQGDGRLRYGARIDVTHNGQTIQLLSVHLKSGCFENRTRSADCPLLPAQVPVLEGWIDGAARGPRAFIVLGDFNRRLNQPGDRVWADLDDGDPANADLTALTQDMPVSCRDNAFTELIDHSVVDPRALPWVDRASFRQVTYRQADKAVWHKLSDHCPVAVELWVR